MCRPNEPSPRSGGWRLGQPNEPHAPSHPHCHFCPAGGGDESCNLSDKSEPISALQIKSAASYTGDALESPRAPYGAHCFHRSAARPVPRLIRGRLAHRRANGNACFSKKIHGASRASFHPLGLALLQNNFCSHLGSHQQIARCFPALRPLHKIRPPLRLHSPARLRRSPYPLFWPFRSRTIHSAGDGAGFPPADPLTSRNRFRNS